MAVASDQHVIVEYHGVVVCDTRRSVRVCETSHPPAYYLPFDEWLPGSLEPAPGSSFCEFKGVARYLSVVTPQGRAESAAWTYPTPAPGFESIADHIAVYPAAMSRITVNGEQVIAQEGGFYGGWITSRVVGPFKGAPGTRGW